MVADKLTSIHHKHKRRQTLQSVQETKPETNKKEEEEKRKERQLNLTKKRCVS
jgi:hypothetical protein